MYPALAVLQTFENQLDDVLWVGGEGGMEADLIHRQQIPYTEIPAAGVHGVGLRSLPGNLIKLIRGYVKSRKILKQFKPDVLFFTGGYVAAPMAIAGLSKNSVLYVPDIEPGLALKFLSYFAKKIAVTNESSFPYFKNQKKLVTTGYPTRSGIQNWDKQQATSVFDLHQNKPVLLCFGGSKGARSINRALIAHLEILLQKTQIIHVSGNLDWEEVQNARAVLPQASQQDYHIYPYLHEEMGAAFTAADLVISRAGASTLGEFPLFGLPAILVPYPYAWRYQKVNAQYLVDQGAAVLLRDELLQSKLVEEIEKILTHPEQLAAMKKSMFDLAHPQAAHSIKDLILSMGNHSTVKGKRYG